MALPHHSDLRNPESRGRDYEELKRRLVSSGALADAFLGDPIARALQIPLKNMNEAATRYEPLLYERWLSELAESLDRLLAFRREARELEVAAVKAAADYELFCRQSEIELALELSRLRVPTKRSIVRSQITTANAFKGKSSSLSQGLEAGASGSAEDTTIDLQSCDDEGKLLQEKQDLIQSFQDAYFARTMQDGNAHNYLQRSQLLWKLVVEELIDAYQRAISIARGIEQIYGIKIQIPSSFSVHLIDDLVFWCRWVLREQALMSQMEVDFDVIIPLVQPLSEANGLMLPSEFLQAVTTNDLAEHVQIKFSIAAALFNRLAVRIRRIGASYGNPVKILDSGADRNATTDSYAKYRMTVSTPVQGTADRQYQRPQVRLGLVSIFGAAPLCYSDGPECINISPIGDWEMLVDRHPSYKDDQRQNIAKGIAGERMLDIKLHLKLRTVGDFKPQ